MKDNVRINFEFPKEHYPFLKMMCAQKGVSLRAFTSEILIREIEEYEDRVLTEKAEKRLKESNAKDNIDFEEAMRLAGWDDGQKIQPSIQQKLPKRSAKNSKKCSK